MSHLDYYVAEVIRCAEFGLYHVTDDALQGELLVTGPRLSYILFIFLYHAHSSK